MKYNRGLNFPSLWIGLAVWLLGAGHGVSQDQLQFPSLSQEEPNLLKPFTEIQKSFKVGGASTSPYQVVEGSMSWETFGKRVHQSGPTSAFLSFDNVMTVMGPAVNSNLNQVLTVPVSSATAKSYGTKLFLSLGAENLINAFSNEMVLKVRVVRRDPGSPTLFHDDEIKLYGGTHIVNRTSGTGYLFQDPLVGYFKKWNGGSYSYYTLFLPLDPTYFHWPITEVQLIYNDPFPTISMLKPNIHIRGLNIETNIQIQPFLSFTQGDPQWKSIRLNNDSAMATIGCVITSAAMAMRAIGLQKGPDGSDITPGTLVNWLNDNASIGYNGKSSALMWEALTIFTNAARNNGYNNGISMSLMQYRQRFAPNLDPNKKRLLLEGDLANRYPVMLRVPSGKKTVDSDKNRDAHTILAYGLVPDFTSNVSGTYQVNDPGVSSSAPNLWRRVVGNSDWKGKWLYAAAARPVLGSVILPNLTKVVLGSPGRIYVEGAISHYKIGYVDGVNFTNTFPSATYEFIDPNENWEPGVDNATEPPPRENIQVVRIKGRPEEALNVKVVGTGSGPYTLTMDEQVWKNENLEPVYANVKTGTLTPSTVVNASIPASGYGAAIGVGTPPKVSWQIRQVVGNVGTTTSYGDGDAIITDSAFKPSPDFVLIGESQSGQPLAMNFSGNLINSRTGVVAQLETGFLTRWLDGTKKRLWLMRLSGNSGLWMGDMTVSDQSGNATTMRVEFRVGRLLSIHEQPQSQVRRENERMVLRASANGDPYNKSFQWYKDGIPVQGVPPSSPIYDTDFIINSVKSSDAGQYYCVFKQLSGTEIMAQATSIRAQVDVIPADSPILDHASPPHLVRGGLSTIYGANFGYNNEAVKVLVNGRKLSVMKASDSEIRFKVPTDIAIGSAAVKVEVYGVVSSGTLSSRIVSNIVGPIILPYLMD